MPRMLFFLLIVIIFILAGCSKDNKDLIVGIWVADVGSQQVGVYDELSPFNYLEITESNIYFKRFVLMIQEGKTVRKFNDTIKNSTYVLKPENKIWIDDRVYEIKLESHEMSLENENFEIHYYKEGK